MAIRTVSTTGGNFNATSSWVEGIVPTSADDIYGLTSSGPLTINVISSVLSMSFSQYANTLAMNAQLSIAGNSVNSFASGMTISGTSNLRFAGSAGSITSNGRSLPNVIFRDTKTMNDIVQVGNISFENTTTINGTGLNCSGNWSSGFSTISGTAPIILNGTGTINMQSFSSNVTINTSGTITQTAQAGFGPIANATLNLTAATFSNGGIKLNNINGTINLGCSASQYWPEISVLAGQTRTTINLTGDLNCRKLFITSNDGGGLSGACVTKLSGSNKLNADFVWLFNKMINSGGVFLRGAYTLELTPGPTHSIGALYSLGFDNPQQQGTNAHIRIISASASNAALEVTGTQSIVNTSFSNITAVGNKIYTVGGSTSSTTNIDVINQYYYAPSTGGGGSFTFVN